MSFRPASPLLLLLLIYALPLAAQVCRVTTAGLNRSRKVTGPVHTECPNPVHSAPFGNWGVTSNFGQRRNGHQFDGWCHNSRICDNSGNCRIDCTDGWFEWNSCTDIPLYQAPNCTLYNADNCTSQVTTTGVNVHGTRVVDLPVRCPSGSDRNGSADQGGCRDVSSFSNGTNFMSLYELDPVTGDDLVQTMYFPSTVVNLNCNVWGCAPAGTDWLSPSFYDSPAAPAKVSAEMAWVVSGATFVNTNQACRANGPAVVSVSAASFDNPVVSPESIASAFSEALSTGTASATSVPLPTSLAGSTVRVTDAAGVERLAPLFYVSPSQINYQVPLGTSNGTARVTVTRSDGITSTGSLQITTASPGLFAANANGMGVASALAVTVSASGAQSSRPVFVCGSEPASCVSQPIEFGLATDSVILLLFGTGIRNYVAAPVSVSIGGENAEVLFAGPQGQFIGLDQVNVRLPRSLQGRGEVNVVVSIAGTASNPVTVRL